VKSFARIHETNLKKQGMLALTFANPKDYDLIRQDDTFKLDGFAAMKPGKALFLVAQHADGTKDRIKLNHTYNEQQISWLREGSALNKIRKELIK
jgi:aconitate hydratase